MSMQLYEKVWEHEAYRVVAPGVSHVPKFLELAKPCQGATVVDLGTGTGRGAARIAALSQVNVCAVDFASNCLDPGVLSERVRFLQHDLTKPLPEQFDLGFCTDVLEHIAPEDVNKVLHNVCHSARKVYLAISTVDDVMGVLVGEPLHLTVESPFWWHDKLQEIGFRVDWSHYQEGLVCFWGSVYANAQDIVDRSKLNVEDETLRVNIRANLGLGLREVVPHETQDTTVYLLAGGPSLTDFEQHVVAAGRDGVPIVTVNGTYGWLLERGIRPAAQVMVDAREFNRRFVTPVMPGTKYLISSQCDHEVLRSLPADQVWMWHSGAHDILRGVLEEFPGHECFPVFGGTTVITRALTLLAMLGFRRVEVFGWDSCLRGDVHHAYSQTENDDERVIEIESAGRRFNCHPWMVVQAHDFQIVVRNILAIIDGFELVVHGDGLISHILNTAAGLANKE